jgi:hypothetical protein
MNIAVHSAGYGLVAQDKIRLQPINVPQIAESVVKSVVYQ